MSVKRRLLVSLSCALILLLLPTLSRLSEAQPLKNPGTLVLLAIGDPETLDPSWAYDTTSAGVFLWNIYETLVFFDRERTAQYVPMLAMEVPSLSNGGISRDGKVYTFKVRQGVKFHDGSTMTAADVKYSLMRFALTDRDGGPSWILLAPILGFEQQTTRDQQGKLLPDIWNRFNRAIQVKGNTVVITLRRPYAPFLNIMATWSMIVSRKFVVRNGGWDGGKASLAKYNNPKKPDVQELFTKASGTGPFQLERWDRKTSTVTLVRNDAYWRALAKLRRVIVKKVEEFGPRRLALQNGDADIIEVDRRDQPAVTGMSGVRIEDNLARLGTNGLFMNLNIVTEGNPDIGSGRLDGSGIPGNFFADVHIRRGFAHLFDRDKYLQAAERGKGRIANGPIPFGMLGHNAQGKWYEVSKDKAIAEFKEAHGGLVWEKGFKFTVLYPSGHLDWKTGAQMLKEAVEALNPKFKVDIRSTTWPAFLDLINSKKAPMFFVGWLADYADPDNFIGPFMSSSGTYSGSTQSYKNAEADRLIEAAAKETDQQKRAQMYFRLQEIAYEDIPTIYTDYPAIFVVMRSWVRGWYHNPMFFDNALYLYRYAKE